MNDLEQRLERIEDAILELALAVEDDERKELYSRIGEILFQEGEIKE